MMKYFLLLAILATTFTNTVFAQSSKKAKAKKATTLVVPANIKTAYSTTYSDEVSPVWKKSAAGNYVAVRTNADASVETIEYDTDAVIINNKIDFKSESIPATVTDAVAKSFPGASVVSAEKVATQNYSPFYKVKIKTGERERNIMITESGRISL